MVAHCRLTLDPALLVGLTQTPLGQFLKIRLVKKDAASLVFVEICLRNLCSRRWPLCWYRWNRCALLLQACLNVALKLCFWLQP